MNEKDKPQTAEEFLAELRRNPAFVEQERRSEEERQRKQIEFRRSHQSLLDELASVGVKVQNVWDLVNTGAPYSAAVPVLLNHLQRDYPDRVREGIARALAVPEARKGWPILLEQFRQDPDRKGQGAKGGIAVAIAALADDDVIDDVIALLADPQHGSNRILLVDAVARSSAPRARQILQDLSGDSVVADEIRHAARRRRKRG